MFIVINLIRGQAANANGRSSDHQNLPPTPHPRPTAAAQPLKDIATTTSTFSFLCVAIYIFVLYHTYFFFTMLSLTLLSFLSAGAFAALGPTSDDPKDFEWSFHPDPTAAEYLQRGSEVPPQAAAITKVIPESSYVVKLDCLGCPFRVRTAHGNDYFTAEPENSLVCSSQLLPDYYLLYMLTGKTAVELYYW
jgi:hypothetical protein